MAVTGQTIISNALTHLGLLAQGGTPNVSDSNYGLQILNVMWNGWQVDEGLIYAVLSKQFALTANLPSYQVGPTSIAPFDIPLPPRIYGAVMVVTVGTALVRRTLAMVGQEKYYSHGDLGALAAVSDEFYADFNVDPTANFGTLYLFPAPACQTATFLELEMAAVFSTWALGTNYNLPYGYQDALEQVLAWRMIPGFGMAVAQQTAQIVEGLGMKAEARIREMNSKNRQLTPQQTMAPGSAPPPAPPPPRA